MKCRLLRTTTSYCPFLPEHHHVHGVVSEASDQRSHSDDKYDRKQQMRAAVWTRSRTGESLAPGYTTAVGIKLFPAGKERKY